MRKIKAEPWDMTPDERLEWEMERTYGPEVAPAIRRVKRMWRAMVAKDLPKKKPFVGWFHFWMPGDEVVCSVVLPMFIDDELAAIYCGLSKERFLEKVEAGSLPQPNDYDRWDRRDLDTALDAIRSKRLRRGARKANGACHV